MISGLCIIDLQNAKIFSTRQPGWMVIRASLLKESHLYCGEKRLKIVDFSR